MNGRQRWYVNKFQKYNLFNEKNAELMDPIEPAEEKEAQRIKAVYEKGTYSTFVRKVAKLCLTHPVDRRIVFELPI